MNESSQKREQFVIVIDAPTMDFQSWLTGYIRRHYGQNQASQEMARVYVGGLNRGSEHIMAFLAIGPLSDYSKRNVARFEFKFMGDKTELLAECWDPVFWPTFGKLLAAIVEWWPGKHRVMEPTRALLEAVIAEQWPVAKVQSIPPDKRRGPGAPRIKGYNEAWQKIKPRGPMTTGQAWRWFCEKEGWDPTDPGLKKNFREAMKYRDRKPK